MVFTGVDVGVAVLVLISAILATARGFTREVLSLATWAGSAPPDRSRPSFFRHLR